jgi:hypothetical protein
MDVIGAIEGMAGLVLQSLEAQINGIHVLGYHRDREQLIENLRRMALSLSASIEVIRDAFISEIEIETEQMMHTNVVIKDSLIRASESLQDEYSATNVANLLDERHKILVKTLGAEEDRIEDEILNRFAVMQASVQDVLSKVIALHK